MDRRSIIIYYKRRGGYKQWFPRGYLQRDVRFFRVCTQNKERVGVSIDRERGGERERKIRATGMVLDMFRVYCM